MQRNIPDQLNVPKQTTGQNFPVQQFYIGAIPRSTYHSIQNQNPHIVPQLVSYLSQRETRPEMDARRAEMNAMTRASNAHNHTQTQSHNLHQLYSMQECGIFPTSLVSRLPNTLPVRPISVITPGLSHVTNQLQTQAMQSLQSSQAVHTAHTYSTQSLEKSLLQPTTNQQSSQQSSQSHQTEASSASMPLPISTGGKNKQERHGDKPAKKKQKVEQKSNPVWKKAVNMCLESKFDLACLHSINEVKKKKKECKREI